MKYTNKREKFGKKIKQNLSQKRIICLYIYLISGFGLLPPGFPEETKNKKGHNFRCTPSVA
jgi:hypothetical protein